MNTSDVIVRRLRGGSTISRNDGLSTNNKPVTVTVHEGIEDFQISGLESFQDD